MSFEHRARSSSPARSLGSVFNVTPWPTQLTSLAMSPLEPPQATTSSVHPGKKYSITWSRAPAARGRDVPAVRLCVERLVRENRRAPVPLLPRRTPKQRAAANSPPMLAPITTACFPIRFMAMLPIPPCMRVGLRIVRNRDQNGFRRSGETRDKIFRPAAETKSPSFVPPPLRQTGGIRKASP